VNCFVNISGNFGYVNLILGRLKCTN